MEPRPDDGAMAALFRLIAARAPGAEIAVYAVGPRRIRLVATTSMAARLAASRVMADWGALAPRIEPILASGGCARIDPVAFGLGDGFGVLQPLRGPGGASTGFLLVGDARKRRLGPGLAAALADAARVAAPLLAAAVATVRPPRAAPSRGAALSEAAARGRLDLLRRVNDAPWPVLLIDLDRFRSVGAALGITASDALLGVIAARLQTRLAPDHPLSRIEVDRFVILTARPPAEADRFGARLLTPARQSLVGAGRSDAARADIGTALGAPRQRPKRTLAPQTRRTWAADGRLERDLAEAAARGQMRLVYQGYLDLADGRVSGVEALLRWRHPVRGELAPAEFIPLAETSGLILPLGAWALRAALAAAARWPPRLALSVNVSALQFRQPGFVAEIDAALIAAGVAPERLELEITETVLMRDDPDTTAQLEALIARGVRIALDDFGTGYSALAYLGRLPHHRIKLDRAFVQDLGNPATLELVRAITALARRTGVAVTAEGVERPDQLSLVRDLGFTHAQGFVTGPPVEDPISLLEAREPAL